MSTYWDTNKEIMTQKQAVALEYISVFKKELSDTEKDVLTQDVEAKLKHALVSQDISFENIMKQFDGVLVESMKTRVQLFLQEKREILAKTNTQKSLAELKKNIKASPSDPGLREMWWVMLWGWWADWLKHKSVERLRNKNVDVKAVESSVDDMVRALQQRLRSAELTKPMKKELQQTIKEVNSTKNYIGSTQTLAKWKDLVDAKILPVDLLKKITVSPAMKASLESITTQKLASEFVGKSASEIKVILASKNITNLADDTIELLAKGKTVDHIDDIVHILSESSHLSKFAKIIGKIPFLDAAIIGYDIHNYNHSKKAEKDKVHLGITTTANLAAALWPIFWTWPVGWAIVGTGVAADIAMSHAVDVWYYDIKDEFHQSKQDLSRYEISELKQVLIESVAVKWWLSRSSNEAMYDTISGRRGEDDGKTKTSADIVSVLVAQSESQLWNDTNPAKNPRIAQRLHFAQSYLPGGRNAGQLSQALQWSYAMKMIDKILSDSMVYADMRLDKTTTAKDVTAYKKEQIWQLQRENPNVFAQLEDFVKKDPLQASEFIHQVAACAPALTKEYEWHSDDGETQTEISTQAVDSEDTQEDEFDGFSMQDDASQNDENVSTSITQDDEKTQKVHTMIDFVQRYMKAKSLTNLLPDVPMTDNKYLSTEEMLVDLADGKPLQTYSKWQSEEFVKYALLDRNDSDQVENFKRSSDLRQNIIYRLAQSFHAYKGDNTMQSLIQFFAEKNEGDSNKKWIYYDLSTQQWMINDDYEQDQPLKFDWIETKSVDEIIQNWTTKQWYITQWLWIKKEIIDTKTETPDAQLNQEFISTVRTILTEEKKYLSPAYKSEITKKVMDYLTMTKPEAWKYIKLPWYLILQAQQAQLGNLSDYYFAFGGWKRKALTVNDRLASGGNLPGIEVQYIVDKDGANNKWELSASEFDALRPITLSSEKLAITTALKKNIHSLAANHSALAWVGRGEVSYDPVSEQLSSWKTTTKISVKNGWYVLDDGLLSLKYKTADEAIHMAMLKNRYDGKYKKEHQDIDLRYQSYMEIWPKWLRDINNGWSHRYTNDTRLIPQDSIEKYFSTSFSDAWRSKKTLQYLTA